ncbi:MAG: hypothetical protein U0835_00570 [Isosphaeraceae bacterium]
MANPATFLAGPSLTAADMDRQVAKIPVGQLKHPASWIREDLGTKEERQALARSYLHRPNNLILVHRDGTIREGNRRVASILEEFGPDTPVTVCVTDEEITEEVALEIMLETSDHTKALTPYERYVGYSRLLKVNAKTARDLSARLQTSEATVSRILALGKCCPEVHEAAKAGKIGPSDWAAIANSPDQLATLALKLGGAPASKLKAATRPARKSATVVVEKMTLHHQSGAVVKVSGEGLSLDATAEILADLVRQMKKAAAQGLDGSTFQAVLKDMASAKN